MNSNSNQTPSLSTGERGAAGGERVSILRRYRTDHAKEYRRTHPDRGGGQRINDCYWAMVTDHCSNTISTVQKDNMLCLEFS